MPDRSTLGARGVRWVTRSRQENVERRDGACFEKPWDLVGPDKVAHAAAYFLLSGLLLWGFSRRKPLQPATIFTAIALSVGYGVAMEILQWSFFPYRFFELYDILSNIIGSFASVLLIFFINKSCQYE